MYKILELSGWLNSKAIIAEDLSNPFRKVRLYQNEKSFNIYWKYHSEQHDRYFSKSGEWKELIGYRINSKWQWEEFKHWKSSNYPETK